MWSQFLDTHFGLIADVVQRIRLSLPWLSMARASARRISLQKLLSAARAYGEELRSYVYHNPTADHGDMHWVEAAYYDGEMERELTERLATVPVKI